MTGRRILACAFACCPPGKPSFGGGEDALGWQLVMQVARFHPVWVLTDEKYRTDIGEFLEEEPSDNLHFCHVGLPSWLAPLLRIQGGHQFYYHLWQIRAYFVARKLHRKVGFSLFHHITYANDWLASLIGAFLPIPYIRGPGGGAHRTPKGFESEYVLGGRIWEKVRSIGQWLLRHDPVFIKGHSRASAILVCNREALSSIPKKWSHKALLFPVSGISAKYLAITAPPKTEGARFQVISAGSLIRVKGFSLAIKSFKEFSDKYPDSELTIVGKGPEGPRLRALIGELQLSAKVHLLDWMRQDDLLEKMASCDVSLFPSLRDGGGTVVIEAMSVGKPVVCLANGGPDMHITDDCGIKIAPQSPKHAVSELASALEKLYLDESLRFKMGEAARKKAAQEYQWDRLGDRLFDIYKPFIQSAPDPDLR
jgi:glycosyltransferase involved in cell wall biosynthesis